MKCCFAWLCSLQTYFPWGPCRERWLVNGIYNWFDCSWILFPNFTKISTEYLQMASKSSIVTVITQLTFCLWSKAPIKGSSTKLRGSRDTGLSFCWPAHWLLPVPVIHQPKGTVLHPADETHEPQAFSWWCVLVSGLQFTLFCWWFLGWGQCLNLCTQTSLPVYLSGVCFVQQSLETTAVPCPSSSSVAEMWHDLESSVQSWFKGLTGHWEPILPCGAWVPAGLLSIHPLLLSNP